MSEVISLKDIVPKEVEVELDVEGTPATYTLKKWSLACDAWLEQTFKESREKFFAELNMTKLTKLLFFLLKDKASFAAKRFDDFDDDGNKVSRIKTGPERLAECIVGEQMIYDVTQAILRCIGYSNPSIDVKKKRMTKK